MNGLSEFLVESIIGESQENVAINALFGGGFKPPTRGHLEVVLQGIKQNPDIDKIYIAVGAKTRDGVTQDESIKVWEKYQKLIPIESEIIAVGSPFEFYKEYLKLFPNDKTYIFMGAREGNEGDDLDVAQRSDFIKRYSNNVIPVKISTPGGVSGTLSRKYLNTDPDRFLTTLPDQLSIDDKKEVYNTLISEADNMGEADKIFVMKSPFTPKGQKWDHIGFVLKDGRLKDMSGHRYDEKGKKQMPPMTYKFEDTEELFNMPKTKEESIKQGIYKEKPLPKKINVPSTIACNIDNPKDKAENCGSFVKIVLHNNGIETTKSNWMGDIYDSIKENLNEEIQNKILYAFDLDDTLITSKSDVIVTNPEKGTFRLTPAEYALYEPGPDDELDFSEFAMLKDPKIIKDNFELFSKILEKSSQLSGAKTIILTARQPLVAKDLKAFLEKKNLPQVTLHAVGSSDPNDKLKVIQDYIDKGFNKIRFYDDAKPNVDLIKTLKSPEVDVIARLVKHGPLKESLMEEEKNDPFGLIQFINEIAKEEKFNHNPYIDSLNNYMLEIGMNISPLPSVTFIDNDADNAADVLGTTAFYDPNQHEIVLYTMGRHPKDILRSYAHEMIHHIQNLENRLGEITTTDTREDDHLTELEREAYTDGNLTFRKWTETLNEGQIKELSLSNPQQIKFWALFAHIFDILKKDPTKFEELENTLKGESLNALYYFWDLLKSGELNERRKKLEYA